MKLIMENWRQHVNEIGMSQAALGLGDEEYEKAMKPAPMRPLDELSAKEIYDIISFIDPTQITSYPEAALAIKNFTDKPNWFNAAIVTVSLLAIIPLFGKLAKAGKLSMLTKRADSISKKLKTSKDSNLIKKADEIEEIISTMGNLSGYQKTSVVSLYKDTIKSLRKLIGTGKAISHQGLVFRGIEAPDYMALAKQVKIPGLSDKQSMLTFKQAYRKASMLADKGSNKFVSIPVPSNTKAKLSSSKRIEGGVSFSKDVEKAHLFSRNRGITGGDSSGDVVILIKARAKNGNNVDIMKTYEINPEVSKRFAVDGQFKKTDIAKEREVVMFTNSKNVVEIEEILIRWKKNDNIEDTLLGKGRTSLTDKEIWQKGIREE